MNKMFDNAWHKRKKYIYIGANMIQALHKPFHLMETSATKL